MRIRFNPEEFGAQPYRFMFRKVKTAEGVSSKYKDNMVT